MYLNEGQVVSGRYEVKEKLGAGGMSVVYRALDTKLDRSVTLKALRTELALDISFSEKMKEEARAVAKLNHPNIVGIYDEGQEGDLSYIIVEYVDGQTLKELIEKKAPFENGQIIGIASQISTALAHAHAQKIIHRDIKPQNIMIGVKGAVKVTDFGLARVAAPNGDTLNARSLTMGSVHYLSPEQARGGFIDERSDLYSLGIVMFEMATGQLPFDGDKNVTVALKHINSPMPDIRALNPNISPALESIISRLTEKTMTDRYQSAKEVLRDLKEALLEPEKRLFPAARKDSPTKKLSKAEIAEIRGKSSAAKEIKNELEEYEEPAEEKKHKRTDSLMIVGGLITSLILIVIIMYIALPKIRPLLYQISAPPSEAPSMIVIPDLSGMLYDEAEKECANRGLILVKKGSEANDEFTMDRIIEQNYEKGGYVAPGTELSVIVSTGSSRFKVPDFNGAFADDITMRDFSASYTLRTEYLYNNYVEEGYIIRQEPTANTYALVGSEIVLFVSLGGEEEERIAVPNLLGKTEKEAQKSLENLGLTLGNVTSQTSEDYATGLVIAQGTLAGQTVLRNSAVGVVLSKGKPRPTEAPATPQPTEEPEETGVPEIQIPVDDTPEPTQVPATQAPTAKPTQAPTAKPTQVPTAKPTQAATQAPEPTQAATQAPTPTQVATQTPATTQAPATPTQTPAPTVKPTETPVPTVAPTVPPVVIDKEVVVFIVNTLSPVDYSNGIILVKIVNNDTGATVYLRSLTPKDFSPSLRVSLSGQGTVQYNVYLNEFFSDTIWVEFD